MAYPVLRDHLDRAHPPRSAYRAATLRQGENLKPEIQQARRDFAVVIPAFNEAPVVPDLVRELREAFQEFHLDGEVVLVDDGSTDGTAEVARREATDWDGFRVISHRRNRGKTEAMVTGVNATDRRCIILFDADLQHSPRDIPRFLEKLDEGWDIVSGRRIGHYDKAAVSEIYNRMSRLLFRVPVTHLNSAMKGFRREILDGLTLRHDWHRFFVVLAHGRGATVTEIDIKLYDRRAGESKYQGLWRVVIGATDLASVAFLVFFSRKPLLLFGASGLALAALGGLIAAGALYLRYLHPALGFEPYVPPFGYRLLIQLVVLLETLGFLLAGFGLVSEQIAHVRHEIEALRRQVTGGTRDDAGSGPTANGDG